MFVASHLFKHLSSTHLTGTAETMFY